MELSEAMDLIRPGVPPGSAIWADIGAGTGMFTSALAEIIGRERESREKGGRRGSGGNERIYAIDKNPHALWSLVDRLPVSIEIVEADFHHPLSIPAVDGIVMANALHFANDHEAVLRNVLLALKPGGPLIVVEYDTDTPKPPWIPNPVSIKKFRSLCEMCGLTDPEIIGSIESRYGSGSIYAALTRV